MWKGQDYFMQVDSHTRFMPDWDQTLIDMTKKTGRPHPVITSYPPSFNDEIGLYDDYRDEVARLCNGHWNHAGIPELRQTNFKVTDKENPPIRECTFVSANFLFADSQFFKDMSFDPHLPYLFHGEEVLFSARLWTNGYDPFAPAENVVFHFYYRNNNPRYWDDIPGFHTTQQQSEARVREILKIPHRALPKPGPDALKEIDKYGLGTKRPLEAYYKKFGVDVENARIEQSWCEGKHD